MNRNAIYQRRMLLAGVAMVIATPILFYGGDQAMDHIHTSPVEWLAEDDPARDRYQQYVSKFEGGNSIVVSWDGCTIDDPRLAKLEAALNPKEVDAETPQGVAVQRLVRRVTSGRSLFDRLTGPPLDLSPQQAKARLRGTMLGPDGESTWLNVVLTHEGTQLRAQSVALVTETATAATGLARNELYVAGPPVDALVIDKESQRSIDVFTIPSGILCFWLCWWSLRSFRFTTAILAVAAFGQVLALGSLYFFRVQMDAVLIVLPPLVFVLVVSAGIHLTNYYYGQLRMGAGERAPERAVQNGLLPCWLAAITTAIGTGSLYISRLVPISMFGIFSAMCVVATVGILFLVLPGVMARWPFDAERLKKKAVANEAWQRWAKSASHAICRFAVPITVMGIALLAIGSVGLTKVRTSINVRSLFTGQSHVIRDFTWLEQNLANLVPLEVVLRFPADSPTRPVDRLVIVNRIQQEIAQMEDVGGTMSLANFTPPIPRGGGMSAVAARAQISRQLERHRQELIDTNFLYADDQGEYWRISARVSGLKEIDYMQVLDLLHQRVEPLLEGFRERISPGLTSVYTGTMPLVYRAQHALLEDMFNSMMLALVLVWIVMCLVLADYSPFAGRSPVVSITARVAKAVWLGALAMLPNVFPIVVVFGTMGLLGIRADIGSTMTACVALGIAVDDTLHFLAWYRRATAAGNPSPVAIGQSIQHCGRAMMQTTLVCGVGMLVFGLSDFVPTQRFAWLMFTLLSTALTADLIFLPAILASPLGRLFAVQRHLSEPDPSRGSIHDGIPRASATCRQP